MKKTIIICYLGILSSIWASSEPKTIDVDIKSMIVEVVKRNSNIVFDRMQNDILDSQVKLEESAFEPAYYATVSHQRTDVPNSIDEKSSRNALNVYEENANSVEFGVKGVLAPYGSQWSIGVTSASKESNLIKSYNYGYSTEIKNGLNISFVQPLLKGFGEYGAMGKVNLAKSEKSIYDKTSEKNIMDMMGSVIQTYWKYYSAIELKKSYSNSISLNEKVISLLEKKFEVGEIPYTEVLEAKSATLIRRAQLQKIDSEIKKYKNDFLTLLNQSSYENSEIEFNLLEKPNLEEEDSVLNLNAYFEKALDKWPEFEIAKKKLEKELLQVKITENYVKPQLDIVTSVSTSTLDDDINTTVYEDGHISWSIMLQYSRPLYDTQSSNALRIARTKANQVKLEIETLKNGLYNAIDVKLKSYYNSKREVDFYKESLRLKKKLLDFSRKAFDYGEKSIKEVIIQEDDMVDYQNKFFNALIDYKLSKASLDKAIGELFEKYLTREEIKKIKNINYEKKITRETFGVIN